MVSFWSVEVFSCVQIKGDLMVKSRRGSKSYGSVSLWQYVLVYIVFSVVEFVVIMPMILDGQTYWVGVLSLVIWTIITASVGYRLTRG